MLVAPRALIHILSLDTLFSPKTEDRERVFECSRMAASVVAAKAGPSILQQRLESSPGCLRPAFVSKAFGLRAGGDGARISCSMEDVARRAADAGKIAVATVAATLLVAGSASANPKRLTYDEIQAQTYLEVKGTGTANQCPKIADGAEGGFKFKPGTYSVKKFCLEPTSFTVKKESPFKGGGDQYVDTKLMTRLTYTLDEIEADLSVDSSGNLKLVEKDGIDYAAVTVQLPGGERVPFLFTIKQLVATGTPDGFSGSFLVPSYRGSSFLDPKGRGGSTGYDNAVALPAGGAGDEEELGKENLKDTSGSSGKISLKVAESNVSTGEIAGVFESVQPSDTDLGSKAPKEVKIEGIWYAQLD